LLRVNKGPRLIDLYALGHQVAYVLIVIGHTDFANVGQKLGDGAIERQRNQNCTPAGAPAPALGEGDD
jgi:hypothetical protein